MTDNPDPTAPDPAKARYLVLMVLRFTAALMVMFGVVLAFGDRDWVDPAIARPLGYVLIVTGVIDLTVVVPMLVRRWRSPR